MEIGEIGFCTFLVFAHFHLGLGPILNFLQEGFGVLAEVNVKGDFCHVYSRLGKLKKYTSKSDGQAWQALFAETEVELKQPFKHPNDS